MVARACVCVCVDVKAARLLVSAEPEERLTRLRLTPVHLRIVLGVRCALFFFFFFFFFLDILVCTGRWKERRERELVKVCGLVSDPCPSIKHHETFAQALRSKLFDRKLPSTTVEGVAVMA